MSYFFTSESVTEGHPDKICDQISDRILDEILKHDSEAKVACECVCTTGLVFVFGEITTSYKDLDIDSLVRETVSGIGYNKDDLGFCSTSLNVMTALSKQSNDISIGVLKEDQGAGDQGIMFGYATSETDSFMPLSLVLANKLSSRLAFVRKSGLLPYLRPDGKTQVTIEYKNNHTFKRLDTILISTQHDPNISLEKIKEDLYEHVISEVIPSKYIDKDTKILINPTGRFVIGGPLGDSGLTGRKIIVDTYGGKAPHGGGAFSGKDPSKVDRSASYMARYIAKNIVAAGLCKECLVQLSYAIGVSSPTSLFIDCNNTNVCDLGLLKDAVLKLFPLTPKGIIDHLDLKRPIFFQTATYGHFGRNDLDLPWERLDKVSELKELLGVK